MVGSGLAALSDEQPIGPWRPFGNMREILRRQQQRVGIAANAHRGHIGGRHRSLYGVMTDLAIGVRLGWLALVSVFASAVTVTAICAFVSRCGLMLMAVMAKVRDLALLMLAIDGRHRPGILDRQYRQQQDEQ
jgi:hypothetical protein